MAVDERLIIAVVAGVVAAVVVNEVVKAWLHWPEMAEAIAAGIAGTLVGLTVRQALDPT